MQARLNKLDGIPGYLWRALSRVLDEGQSWVVITLVGGSTVLNGEGRRISRRFRHWHRYERRLDVHHHRMALRYEDGLLQDWLVVESEVLLPGTGR
jgi:hypothetical protein